jgi:hypothetical protein
VFRDLIRAITRLRVSFDRKSVTGTVFQSDTSFAAGVPRYVATATSARGLR